MLFNSPIFIFAFLPLVWLGFQLLRAAKQDRLTIYWLVAASFVFYGYWDPWRGLPLILFSILVNYGLSRALLALAEDRQGQRLALLVAGLGANLGLLGYFKYANFFADNLAAASGWEFGLAKIVLPIGISFFTFQQIAFIVDAYRRQTVERDFVAYCLFVTFFPQLIAGPIVHHREMMPQFGRRAGDGPATNLAIGLSIFTIGLAKKMLIADGVAAGSSPIFDNVAAGHLPGFWEAWAAALGYSLQICFDFSAYSDMAIGLGRMFGIKLPINFASPYKATSIVDFWRRWHITLSRFLRDYLYLPLGGNRRGKGRRYLNVFATMLLGGIWHGAGWTFVLWGALHGAFIVVNQLWQSHLGKRWKLPPPIGWALTLFCVVIAWVPFRAADLETSWALYRAMAGLNGLSLPGAHFGPSLAYWSIPLFFAIALLLPNTQQWFHRCQPGIATPGYPASENAAPHRLFGDWRMRPWQAVPIALLLAFCLLKLNDFSEFIYFQF